MNNETIFSYFLDKRFAYQSLATLATYIGIKLLRFYQIRRRRFQLFKYYGIPGPEPSLLDGNVHLVKDPLTRFKTEEELLKKYGRAYGIFIGDEPSLIITDLDLLKKLFFEESSSFTERSKTFIDTSISHGILFAKYPRWKVMRKNMSHPFSKYSVRGEVSTQFIETSVKMMLEYIDQRFAESKVTSNKVELDIQDLMKATALHLISAMAVKLPGVQVKETEQNVRSLDKFLALSDSELIVSAIKFPFIKRILEFLANYSERNKTIALINKELNNIIDQSLREFSKANQDKTEGLQVIDVLIKLHHEGKLSRKEVLGNAEAILFAGYDTTSTTLAYIFWVLCKHPEVQERLRSELMAHGVESRYLMQVVNETMRLYPTVTTFTTRLATRTVDTGSIVVPQGCRIVFNSWIIHRNPEIWPDPLRFDTNRFEEGSHIHQCAFAPFGLGDRICLGYQLAMLEMKMIICDVLLRYRLKLIAPQNLELISYASVLTKPREKICVELEKLW